MAKNKKINNDLVVSAPSPTRRTESTPVENVPVFYVNSASFEASNWDFKIKLGRIVSGTKDVITTMEVAHVYMSHDHARAFLAAFASGLEQYDKARLAHTVKQGR